MLLRMTSQAGLLAAASTANLEAAKQGELSSKLKVFKLIMIDNNEL